MLFERKGQNVQKTESCEGNKREGYKKEGMEKREWKISEKSRNIYTN